MIVDFRLIRDERDLAKFLGCHESLVTRILSSSDDELFERHFIPKKGRGGGSREVWELRDVAISDVYKGLSKQLQDFFGSVLPGFPHPAAHGYVPGHSTVTNARAHLETLRRVESRRIVKADIRQFFRSISKDRVVSLFESVGLSSGGAQALAAVIVRENHLPLGLPTSPTMANAFCHDLDHRLTALVPEGCYTRYGDDLTFCGPRLPSKDEVAKELQKDGFVLADDKSQVVCEGQGLYVTGLSIEDDTRPRAPRAWKRRLRQDVHYSATLGLEHHISRRGYSSVQSGINVIHGRIQYLRGIEPTLGIALHQKWMDALGACGYGVSFPSAGTVGERHALFLIDESVVAGSSGPMLVLCLVAIEEPALVRRSLSEFLSERIADPFGGTDHGALRREGLHWNAMTQDDRTKATERLRALPYRAFIAFGRLDRVDAYGALYESLLERLLRDRFVRYDGDLVEVAAEQNSKVDRGTLGRIVTETYDRLATRNARRPKELPSYATVAKNTDPALPIPDLVLGVFTDFARVEMIAQADARAAKKRVPGDQARKRYQQVADKIRAVYDCDQGEVFSRRRPFLPWQIAM